MFKRVFRVISIIAFFISIVNAKIFIANVDSSLFKNDKNITIESFSFKEWKDGFNLLNGAVLIKLELDRNSTVIYFDNPLIEELKVYENRDGKLALLKDLSLSKRDRTNIYPYYITDKKSIYLYANSKYFPTIFNIRLDKFDGEVSFNYTPVIDAIILGVIISIAIGYFILYIFSNRKVYIYMIALIAVIFFNYIYFSGLDMLIFGNSFLSLDMSLVGIKINILIIAFAIFSIHFFKFAQNSLYYRGYIALIFISILEIILSAFFYLYYIYIPLLLIALVYNIFVGYRLLKEFLYESLAYVISNLLFLILVLSYIFELRFEYLIDNKIYYRGIFLISFLLFVSTLFIRYISRKISEDRVVNRLFDKKLVLSSKIDKLDREVIELKATKDRLKVDINTIISNNLSNTLSMLKLKNNQNFFYEITDEISKLNRRLSIYTKLYSTFLSSDKQSAIDMRSYLPDIIKYIQYLYKDKKRIKIKLEVRSTLPLTKAIKKSLYIVDFLIDNFENSKEITNDKIYIKLVDNNLVIKDLNKPKRFEFIKKFLTF